MKRLLTMAAALSLAAPALGAGDAAWDGAMQKTIWEIVHGDPGTAPRVPPSQPVPAGGVFNRHFECRAVQFFGSLQLEVEQVPPPRRAYPDPGETGTVRVRLQGIEAGRAAQSLGLPGADSLEAAFPADWCQFSQATPGVFSCELPDWKWPRPVLTLQAFDRDGHPVGTGTVAVYRIGAEKTLRASAGTGADIESQFLEMNASLISETDNAARAELRLPYQPQDCREK